MALGALSGAEYAGMQIQWAAYGQEIPCLAKCAGEN